MIKQLICKQCGKDLPKGRTRYCSSALLAGSLSLLTSVAGLPELDKTE